MMNKKVLFALIIFVITFLAFIILYNTFKPGIKNNVKKENKITQSYSEYVITKKSTKLYKKNDTKYAEYGNVNKNVKFHLEKSNSDNKYFKIINTDLYIYYDDVKSTEKFNIDDRFNYYIPFNNNIITSNSTSFYDNEDNYLFTINNSFDFKVLVKDTDRYGIQYNNELLYIHSGDVTKIYENDNGMTNKDKIRTLTYHFLYDSNNEECNQDICHTLDQFEAELKYLRENNFFTMKLSELEMYLDGKINIPKNSIVLTIDDGTLFNLKAIELLEKYKVNLTMFVITSFVSNIDALKSDYLDLESHTHNMHNQYECPGYGMQGGGILCLPEEQVLNDLKTSQDILGGSTYFAYPFFDFNDRAIKLLKEAGFKLAFIGQYDTEGYSYKDKTDRYKLRRMGIFSDTDLNEFISYLD